MDLSEKRGQTWNESKEYLDPITLRKTRKVTNTGEYNNTIGYHTGIGWSGDGENLLLVMGRNGLSALVNCHVPTGDLTQWHATWRWDGKYVYYHGYNGKRSNLVRPCQDGWYVGAIDTNGKVYREYAGIGWMNYGHVGSLGTTDKILLDGNVTTDMVLALSYEEEWPQLEMVARHNTFWHSNFGQMCHPHTTSSHDGRYIAFNSLDRNDVSPHVYVVEYGKVGK